jgi:hypothetical protein
MLREIAEAMIAALDYVVLCAVISSHSPPVI